MVVFQLMCVNSFFS